MQGENRPFSALLVHTMLAVGCFHAVQAAAWSADARQLARLSGGSEESVDEQTKTALSLDSHPKRGGALFRRYCTTCHGATAHGSPSRGIPALAGQRFAYLIRQLANFSGGERDAHGDGDGFAPSLRDQHYGYLVGQLHQLAQRARHNLDSELSVFIGNFDDGEICAVADYLSRLHGPGRRQPSIRANGTAVD